MSLTEVYLEPSQKMKPFELVQSTSLAEHEDMTRRFLFPLKSSENQKYRVSESVLITLPLNL